jgi:Glycosyltransferase family 9 (heptosyltransferase)
VLGQLPPWAADCYLRLLTGDLAEGFRRFEVRHRVPLPGVPWTGQPIAGRTILLKGAEGGFGDDLMFARYIPMIAERGGRIILMIQRKLARLLAAMPGIARIIPTDPFTGSPEQMSAPGVAVQYDYWASLMSLPHAFGTTLETIPSRQYLHGDPTAWRPFLNSLPGLRVGICWAGEYRPGQPFDGDADKRRSMRLADMAPLLSVPGCSFVSLQMGPPARQLAGIPPGHVHDVSPRLTDWQDTADLVSGLDLVISVDTAVCHLAGAVGAPTWLLNRHDTCWRWLLDRTDSPWYPSMRIFRQNQSRDWAHVIRAVVRDLGTRAAQN